MRQAQLQNEVTFRPWGKSPRNDVGVMSACESASSIEKRCNPEQKKTRCPALPIASVSVLLFWGMLVLDYGASFGQLAIAVNPAHLADPRGLHVNPAVAAAGIPRAYLGMKLLYPGVLENNTFGMKASLLNASSPKLTSWQIAAGVRGQYFSTPLYSESGFGLALAKSVLPQLHLGIDLGIYSRRYHTENFEGVDPADPVFQKGSGISVFDPSAGVIYRVNDRIDLAASLRHFTRPRISLGGSEFRQPMATAFGLGFTHHFARADLAAQYWQNEFRPIFGAEFFDQAVGRLRLGFALNNAALDGQLLLRGNASLFYSFTMPTGELNLVSAGSHEFGLLYEFKPKESGGEAGQEFQLLVIPNEAAIRPGEAALFKLKLSSPREKTADLNLAVIGAPEGVQLRPAKARVSSHDETVISLQSSSSTMPGEYALQLAGRNRNQEGRADLRLRILATPPLFAELQSTVDTVVITESRVISEELPLIPRVFFAKDSYILAQARYDLLPETQSEKFSQSVRELNSTYRNLLNLVAGRLRAHPQAVLTVRGFSPGPPVEMNPQEVSRRRAEYVREHFVNVLRVEARQVRAETGKPEIAEAATHDPLRLEELQRVDLEVPGSWEETIFAPIVSEKMEIDALPKQCGFVVNRMQPGAGLRHWRLIIMSRTDTVEVLQGKAELPDTIWWNWQFDPERISSFWREVRASLQLSDAAGQMFETPWLAIASKQTRAAIMHIEKIPLILFAFDEYELDRTSARLRTKLKQIAGKLLAEPRATCALNGYTDEIGETEHNYQLSVRRARNVMRELSQLGVAPGRMSHQGFGESAQLADNRLPEGRMLNRRVEVHIRHAQ